jgi:ATP-dependent helicase/nuclease subunit B
MELASNEIGLIIHHCLEHIIKNNTKEDFINLREHDIKIQIESFANEYKETNLGGDYGKTARFEYNFKRVKNSIFQTVKHLQEEFSQLEFTPVEYELKIDEHGDCNPLTIKNADGVELMLCGTVDRVDVYSNEKGAYVRIIDYKSGSGKKLDTSKIPYGLDLQMFLYLFAITGKSGKYHDYKPAGVLYMPVYEVTPNGERSNGATDIDKVINAHFKMKGMVLGDDDVIRAMEKEVKGVYIPFKLKTDGTPDAHSKYLSENQFNKIKTHSENLLLNMANCLSNGDISAQVLSFTNDSEEDDTSEDSTTSLDGSVAEACKNCDYWSICGNYPNTNCRTVNKQQAEKEYENLIAEEVVTDNEEEEEGDD